MSATGGRRIVSVLVADVAGSTSIAERLGPERSKFLFDDVVRLMREEVERFGGTVAQLTGDGVLALFGAPVGHEDDSERAVRTAVAIREAVAAYGADVAIELSARVAVNTGPVVIPDGHAPPQELYNALGDTVNVAARLQTAGDLVVGPATARQVGAMFELDELGDLELKGKSEKVTAFRVGGVRETAVPRPEPALVGRGGDLRVLGEALDGLVDGGGAIVSITGEPGIGKSRLVAEARDRFAGKIRFLAGHAVAYAESLPYWPVRELVRGWLGLGVSDPEARVRLELRAEVARLLRDDADEAYPFLALLLGLPLDPGQEQRVRGLARDAVQHETFYWLHRLLVGLTEEQPVCVVLDDLHWSDDATLALLDDLLPVVQEVPVAFMIIHRSDPDHPAWQLVDRARRRFRHCFSELELEPLEDADARVLATAAAGGELPGELAALLAERAGGNPYFVAEAIRDLRERGAVQQEDGHVVLVGEVSVPTAIQEALQARIDRLDPQARKLLTTAAVIGRAFGLPLLELLLPRTRLLPTLSELQWLELIVEERGGEAPEYRFRHGLVREVAYGTLVEPRRRELHLQVGTALEELYRESPGEVYGLLGHHFAEAAEPERAVEYLLKAGDAARGVYAQDEAIDLYRRALGFMEGTADDARARQILLRIGLAHHLAFEFGAANAAFGEAFSRRPPPPTRLEPTEHIGWPVEAAGTAVLLSALGYSGPTWLMSPTLFRGLLAVGRDLDVEADLAERFTVSDDGRSYRFTLRSDAHWSDGARVTADDFVFTFARIAEEGLEMAARLVDDLSARAVDAQTLEVRLRVPRNDFLYRVASPPLVAWPRHVREREGPEWHRAAPLVGNGPFVLTGRDERRLVLEAAPAWYGARGNVRVVEVGLEASFASVVEAWRRGAYDVHTSLALGLVPPGDDTVAESSAGTTVWYLAFNASRAPFDDVSVRRACAYAIDRSAPAESIRATPTLAGGLIPPAMPGHSQRVAPPFDQERARALLKDADPLDEITLACLDLWRGATDDIAAQLTAVGVRVQVLALASDPDLQAAIEDRAHAFVWAWGADVPDPGGGFMQPIIDNFPVYRDDDLDGLLARAAHSRDQDERLRLYRDFERKWIGERAALVPFAYADTTLSRRAWITGLWMNLVGMSSFADAVVDRQ